VSPAETDPCAHPVISGEERQALWQTPCHGGPCWLVHLPGARQAVPPGRITPQCYAEPLPNVCSATSAHYDALKRCCPPAQVLQPTPSAAPEMGAPKNAPHCGRSFRRAHGGRSTGSCRGPGRRAARRPGRLWSRCTPLATCGGLSAAPGLPGAGFAGADRRVWVARRAARLPSAPF